MRSLKHNKKARVFCCFFNFSFVVIVFIFFFFEYSVLQFHTRNIQHILPGGSINERVFLQSKSTKIILTNEKLFT